MSKDLLTKFLVEKFLSENPDIEKQIHFEAIDEIYADLTPSERNFLKSRIQPNETNETHENNFLHKKFEQSIDEVIKKLGLTNIEKH